MTKKYYALLILMLILISQSLYSQKLGTLFLGTNSYLASDKDNEYNVNTTGLSVGWLIPINTQNLKIYYKVKAAHHNIKNYYSYSYNRKLDYFFSAVNEILVGPNIKLNDKINIIPQLGFGAIGEAAYYDWDKGFTHGTAFIDMSVIATYDFKNIGLGIMANFEKDIISAATSIISDKRLNISILLIK